jgi:general secretion pathway protein M
MRLFEQPLEFWRGLDSRTRLWGGCAVIALVAVVLGWSALAGRNAQLERKRAAREAVLKELMPLRAAYHSAKASSDTLAGQLASVRPDDSPVKIIEEIGIRGKGVKITPVKGELRGNVQEDAADVSIEGLTANEAINLIYRLEKGARPLLLKRSSLKTRFDDPSRFDLTMTVALLKPAPGPAK